MESKIVVVGSGFVGASIGYAAMIRGLCNDLVLIDINKKRVEGEVMDLSHGLPFTRPMEIRQGDYSDCQGASIIVITAGYNQKPGESRLDLIQKNVKIFHSILDQIIRYEREAILLVVSNPVDILTTIARQYKELRPERIIGSGTVLDTARFRLILSRRFKISPSSIHAYVVGEHGDSEVPLFSSANVAGTPLNLLCEWDGLCEQGWHDQVIKEVKQAAYEIINRKGATYYGIGLSVSHIMRAILRDERTVLTLSSLLDDEYKKLDVALSIPCIIGKEGIVRRLPLLMDSAEKELFNQSVEVIRNSLAPWR